MDLSPDVPVVLCDARRCSSATHVLVSLVQHLLTPVLAATPELP